MGVRPIGETNYPAILKAVSEYHQGSSGFCDPNSQTQGRWGIGISYCDYFMWRYAPRQYCTNEELKPDCDNKVEAAYSHLVGDAGNSKIININEEAKNTVAAPKFEIAQPPEEKVSTEKEIATKYARDLAMVLNRYKGQFEKAKSIGDLPSGMVTELQNLKESYTSKYNL